MGTMSFRDMQHSLAFAAAQDADPEAHQTIQRIIGPGGIATILSQRIAQHAG